MPRILPTLERSDCYLSTSLHPALHDSSMMSPSQPLMLAPPLLIFSAASENHPLQAPSKASPTLCEDILIVIFDLFDTRWRDDRLACARCALVCRSWSGHANKVLWSIMIPEMALPLYNILSPLPSDTVPVSKNLQQYFEKVSIMQAVIAH